MKHTVYHLPKEVIWSYYQRKRQAKRQEKSKCVRRGKERQKSAKDSPGRCRSSSALRYVVPVVRLASLLSEKKGKSELTKVRESK